MGGLEVDGLAEEEPGVHGGAAGLGWLRCGIDGGGGVLGRERVRCGVVADEGGVDGAGVERRGVGREGFEDGGGVAVEYGWLLLDWFRGGLNAEGLPACWQPFWFFLSFQGTRLGVTERPGILGWVVGGSGLVCVGWGGCWWGGGLTGFIGWPEAFCEPTSGDSAARYGAPAVGGKGDAGHPSNPIWWRERCGPPVSQVSKARPGAPGKRDVGHPSMKLPDMGDRFGGETGVGHPSYGTLG